MGKMSRKQYLNLVHAPPKKKRGGRRKNMSGGRRKRKHRPTTTRVGSNAVLNNLVHKRLGRIMPLLPMLTKRANKQRKRVVIDSLGSGEMNEISELTKNFLANNIPVKRSEIGKLRKYQQTMRRIASPGVSLDSKKTLLKQRGGFLGALVPLLGSVLAPVLGKVVGGLFGM
jgi:hypothetical protein